MRHTLEKHGVTVGRYHSPRRFSSQSLYSHLKNGNTDLKGCKLQPLKMNLLKAYGLVHRIAGRVGKSEVMHRRAQWPKASTEFRELLLLSPRTNCCDLSCHHYRCWELSVLSAQLPQKPYAAAAPPQPKRMIHGSSAWPNQGCVHMPWESKHLVFSTCMVGEGLAFHKYS